MSFTVKQLSEISKVSIRTLHYYHEIGLLKPSFIDSSGYRRYEHEKLLVLQQILFFRQLDFPLKKIHELLKLEGFDKRLALKSQRSFLSSKIKHIQGLINTIDKTIKYLDGEITMTVQEMFFGVDPEKQKEYEELLKLRFGHKKMELEIIKTKERLKNFSQEDMKKASKKLTTLCQQLKVALEGGLDPKSKEVQQLIKCHFEWLNQFLSLTKESYKEHGKLILDTDLQKWYNNHNPKLAEFLVEGMNIFAENK